MIIACIFVVVSILRLNHDLDAKSKSSLSSAGAFPASALPLATAAYAVSITACGPKLSARLFDAAAVLRRSIQLNSWPLNPDSRYGAKFYAFTLKQPGGNEAEVDRCYQILSNAGWEVMPQDVPVYNSLIKTPENSILSMGIGR